MVAWLLFQDGEWTPIVAASTEKANTGGDCFSALKREELLRGKRKKTRYHPRGKSGEELFRARRKWRIWDWNKDEKRNSLGGT